MSQQAVRYGSFTFPYPRITVREQFVYENDERTLVGTKYQITVSGWIRAVESSTLTNEIYDMRGALSKPWQQLTIWDQTTGQVLYTFDPVAAGGEPATDDWSPRPEDLTISEVTGMRAARYTWQVSIFKKDCPQFSTPSNILSVTKSFSYSIDVSGYATRQVSGTLKVRAQGAPADLYRSYVTPTLPNRFRRTQQQFSQSPDCRTLTFSIVDMEEYRTLPPLLSDGEATFGVRVADLGARVFYTLNGRFKAPPSTPKPQLFTYLANLINAKFPLTDPSFLFEEASVDEAVYGNEISFHISGSGVAAPVPGLNVPNYGALFKKMLVPPPDSNNQSHLPTPYGDLPGYPHVSPLLGDYDACGTEPGEDNFVPEVVAVDRIESPEIPDEIKDDDIEGTEGVSDQHRLTPYVAYHERVSYFIDYKVVRMDVKDRAPDKKAGGPYMISTSGSSLVTTQAGYYVCYARQASDLPEPPEPIDKFGRILEAYIQPHTPEPVQDGQWKQYTLHWRYVIDSGSYYHGDYDLSAQIFIPPDPRIGNDFDPTAFEIPWLDDQGYPA